MAPIISLVLCCTIAIGLLPGGVKSWSFLPIEDSVLPSSLGLSTRAFMCQADTALTKCQVNIYEPGRPSPAIVDLSLGSATGEVTRRNYLGIPFSVSYNGTGLEHGQCGVVLTYMYVKLEVYGCRGADAAGEWHEMEVAPFGPETGKLPSSVDKRHVVVKPGGEMSMLIRTGENMVSCAAIPIDRLEEMTIFSARRGLPCVTYCSNHGKGMAQGECGMKRDNVTDKDNGVYMMVGIGPNDKVAQQMVSVIVAASPDDTTFSVDKTNYSVGDTLTASCSSWLSRPVANLTWTLDDRIIRQDTRDEGMQDDVWSWSWDKQNITQTMSLELGEEHFGKKLECRVEHLALANPVHHTYVIAKKYSQEIVMKLQ